MDTTNHVSSARRATSDDDRSTVPSVSVLEGRDVIDKMSATKTGPANRAVTPVIVKDCGVLGA